MFSRDEIQQLTVFTELVNSMRNHSVMQRDEVQSRLSVSLDAIRGMRSISYHRIDEDRLDSFLIILRRFDLAGEITNATSVIKLLGRHFRGDDAVKFFRELRQMFLCRGRYDPVELNLGGDILRAKEVWDTYLNADRFHGDVSKMQRLAALRDIEYVSYTVFMNVVFNKVNAVLLTYDFIKSNTSI